MRSFSSIRTRALLGGGAALAVGAAGAAWLLQDGSGPSEPATTAPPTAPVVRTTMVNARKLDGTLGYAGGHTVLAAGGGRVTWLPSVGAVIRRGERVYGVDGHSVPLFYGSTPLWRDLKEGMSDGRDVLLLERNLRALGYGTAMTVDRSFTGATARAVRDWQRDLGVTETGAVRPDAVDVRPGAIRVTRLRAVLGARAAGTVLTASGTERRVTVKMPVTDRAIARKGAKVRVTLPGGTSATGRVSSVGTVATAGSTSTTSQTGAGTENATVPVSITLDGAGGGAGGLDGAPATVAFTSTEHRDVLAVPINALLASADGGYSVNVVEASGTVRPVPVRLGIFDGDRVEVSGDLAAGARVQVPRT